MGKNKRAALCKYYVKESEPYNETGDGYINTGLSMSGTSGGYIKKQVMTKQGCFPTELGGSSDTYYCCGGWYNAGQVDHALVGGGAVSVSNLVSYTYWNVSARPYCKTPTTATASDIEA